MRSLLDLRNPLTIECVLKSSGDTLFVVFDFKQDEWEGAIQELKAYWRAWTERHSVPRVSFLFSDNAPAIECEQSIVSLEHRDLTKGSYVVYGLFDPDPKPNHLVFASFKDTPLDKWKYEQKNLAKNEMGDIGFAAVGRNPLGEGFIVTFSAANPAILVDIKKYLQTNCTFISISQGQIIKRGILNHDFTHLEFLGGSPLEAQEAQVDTDYFFTAIEEIHPQPLRHIDVENYLSLKKIVRTQLQEQKAVQGHISYAYLAGILAEAAARLGDGHTFIEPDDYFIFKANSDTYMFPFRLKLHFNHLLVEYSLSGLENLQGQTLVAINDQPVTEFLRPALRKISGESDAFRLATFIDRQQFYGAWCDLFPSSPVTMRFMDKGGQVFTHQIDLIPLHTYNDFIAEDDIDENYVPSFHRFYHSDKTCYYQYNDFVDSEDERSYIAHLFGKMHEKRTDSLIIDLRNNGGGNSAMGDYLLGFLTDQPYRMFSRVDTKLSELLFKQRTEFTPYRSLANLVVSELMKSKPPELQADIFKGTLYLLIGPRTFSTAAVFAAVIKDYQIGQLIGEETGGRRQTFGDVLVDQLPLSMIRFGISAKVFYAPVPKVDDEYRGTVPHISLGEEELLKYEKTDDPLLYFTLDHIR